MAKRKSKRAQKKNSKSKESAQASGVLTSESKNRAQNSEQQTTFAKWQAAAIAEATLELAEHIETVGNKTSTLDMVDVLRKQIVNAMGLMNVLHNQRIHDIYITILEGRQKGKRFVHKTDGGILAYYECTKSIPDIKEDIEKLRRAAHKLQKFAGDFKEHCPLETMTDKLRELAKILCLAGFIDVDMAGFAMNAIWMLAAIYEDLRPLKDSLTSEQMKARSYLRQAHEILSEVIEIGRFSRTKQKTEPLRDYADRLHDIANELDACTPVGQYRGFWDSLKDKIQSGTSRETTNQSSSQTDKHTYFPIAMSKLQIGCAFGLEDDRKTIARELNGLCKSNSIILKKVNRQKFRIAIDSIQQPALLSKFKDSVELQYGNLCPEIWNSLELKHN